MLMYLYGPDAFRRTAALHEKILEPYQKKYPDATIERFSLSHADEVVRLREFAATGSLFAKTRLGVVTDVPEAPKEAKEIFKTVLEDATITLVVVAEKKLTKEFDFLLKDPIKTYEFELLKGKEFATFVKKQAGRLGADLTTEQINSLSEQYAGDSWAVVTELEKIALGAAPEVFEKAPDFFSLIMRLKGAHSVGDRLSSLFQLLETSEPALVFNMIASLADANAKQHMADYDVAIKSGKLEYEEALTDLVLKQG